LENSERILKVVSKVVEGTVETVEDVSTIGGDTAEWIVGVEAVRAED
jgi:alkylated DNA nucleotide flippase Atl1